MKHFLALLSGVLFGIGLALSGMMDPARVRGFLDLFGAWDPTLAFVMGGALLVMAVAWLFQPRMKRPLADSMFHLPATRHLDGKLLTGAALFGVGWGIAGLCPGPAVASIGTAPVMPIGTFLIALLAGMVMHRLVADRI